MCISDKEWVDIGQSGYRVERMNIRNVLLVPVRYTQYGGDNIANSTIFVG